MSSMDNFSVRELIKTTINSFIISSKEGKNGVSAKTTESLHPGSEISSDLKKGTSMINLKNMYQIN